jgi:hypothetical protein
MSTNKETNEVNNGEENQQKNSTSMLRAKKEAIDAEMPASPILQLRANFCKTVFFSKAPAKAAAPASPISQPDRVHTSVKHKRQPPRTTLHQNHFHKQQEI